VASTSVRIAISTKGWLDAIAAGPKTTQAEAEKNWKKWEKQLKRKFISRFSGYLIISIDKSSSDFHKLI
jgi:hypothetical protein